MNTNPVLIVNGLYQVSLFFITVAIINWKKIYLFPHFTLDIYTHLIVWMPLWVI